MLFARAEVCAPGVSVHLRVLDLARDEEANVDVCDPSGLAGLQADDEDEWIDGESAVWLGGGGQYAVSVTWRGTEDTFVGIDLFTDPTPTIVEADALSDGERTVLTGIGDTAVYLVPPGPVTIDVSLDGGCAQEMAGARGSGGMERPWSIGFCGHPAQFRLTPTDVPTPFVVFNRTGDETVVELAAPIE